VTHALTHIHTRTHKSTLAYCTQATSWRMHTHRHYTRTRAKHAPMLIGYMQITSWSTQAKTHHTHICTHTQTHTHTQTPTHPQTCTHTVTNTDTNTRTHTRTHTHTHTFAVDQRVRHRLESTTRDLNKGSTDGGGGELPRFMQATKSSTGGCLSWLWGS